MSKKYKDLFGILSQRVHYAMAFAVVLFLIAWSSLGRGEDFVTMVTRSDVAVMMKQKVDCLILLLSDSIRGQFSVLVLAVVSASVLLPLTLYQPMNAWSVGYGLSVAALAYTVGFFLQPSRSLEQALVAAAIFYGLRLGIFLHVRHLTGWTPHKPLPNFAFHARIVLALILAPLYAFMMTPVLSALQRPVESQWAIIIAWSGTIMAWLGAVLECIADAHKYANKQGKDKKIFHGPANGLYQVTRHPNYTGEIIFWSGLYIAGLPSFQRSVTAWFCSTAGLCIIIQIMIKATSKLENRQKEKYEGQDMYEEWKKRVRAPLIPFIIDK